MNKRDRNDEPLAERFHELRCEEGESTPKFIQMWDRARLRSKTRPVSMDLLHALPISAAAAVAVVGFIAIRHLSSPLAPPPQPQTISITEWKSSTDFLFETPGREMLQTIPMLGGPPVVIDPTAGTRHP